MNFGVLFLQAVVGAFLIMGSLTFFRCGVILTIQASSNWPSPLTAEWKPQYWNATWTFLSTMFLWSAAVLCWVAKSVVWVLYPESLVLVFALLPDMMIFLIGLMAAMSSTWVLNDISVKFIHGG